MKIRVTLEEISNTGNWVSFCLDKGWNPYFINEGYGSLDEEIELTQKEYKKYFGCEI